MEKWKYSPNLKDISFKEVDKTHAEFRIRLHYDGMQQSYFFRSIVALYLEKDPDMLKCVEKMKDVYTAEGKKVRKSSLSLIKKGKDNMKKLNLSDEEKENIFNILEEEIPDL